MRQRGYTAAFVAILILGCLVVFLGGRMVWQAFQAQVDPRSAWVPPDQRTPTPAGAGQEVAGAPAGNATPAPAPPTLPAAPDLSRVTLTPFASPTPTPHALVIATEPPEPTPIPPTPTPTVAGDYVPAEPVRNTSGDCPGSYVLGRLTDRAGNGLPDVRLQLKDQYGNGEFKTTKGAPEAGRYDFPLYGPPRRFYLSVVNAAGQPLSPEVEIDHGVGADPGANCHWLDWRKK